MTSGGPRRNSGPPPDPSANRRFRPDDAEWTTLPSVPILHRDHSKFPLPSPVARERAVWKQLWLKPQATMWELLGLEAQLAMYTRAFVRAESEDAPVALYPTILRFEGELGISVPGMNSMRWKISTDELSDKRDDKTAAIAGADVDRKLTTRERRMKAIDGATVA
jgi:hypothetical protein